MRTRPLDEQKVLLTDQDALALEEDWRRHYTIVSQRPREVSPEWQARVEAARAAGPHPDHDVEAQSQKVLLEIMELCRAGVAPRDAKDKLLQEIADHEQRTAVDRRVWQLQVKGIFGAR